MRPFPCLNVVIAEWRRGARTLPAGDRSQEETPSNQKSGKHDGERTTSQIAGVRNRNIPGSKLKPQPS